MKRVQQVDVACFVHHGYVVLAERDKLRMGDVELAAIRGAKRERPKSDRQTLPNFLNVHIKWLRRQSMTTCLGKSGQSREAVSLPPGSKKDISPFRSQSQNSEAPFSK